MFSPRREKARADTATLPKGDCRYILLHPEHQGLRCACVGFALNRSIPGSTCDCGHQACYHSAEKEMGPFERQEMDALKAQVTLLQEQLEQQRKESRGQLSRIEELLDKNKVESDAGFKGVYRDMGGLWHHVGNLNKRMPFFQDSIEGLMDDAQRMRDQMIEVDHASIRVEERVEVLEGAIDSFAITRRRKASTPPSTVIERENTEENGQESPGDEPSHPSQTSEECSNVESFRSRVSSVGADPSAWTVHISLLPTYSQPFPFEKDTAAYKRCLSRGLHQMIVIPNSDSFSFMFAVNNAFENILLGRPWQPLAARICDAKNLRGLPMLRQLEPSVLELDHDLEFLQKNCAVVDESGKILDLYIAMSNDTLSWAELRNVDSFLPGLEGSWTYDPYLDGPTPLETDSSITARKPHDTEKRPAAGDILPSWSSSLKRNASEISRTPSFGSSTDGERTRAKLRRQYPEASVELVGRRAEAV